MGARQSRQGFQNWDLNQIQQATGLPADQVQQIQKEFFQAAGRDGVLSRNEFANLYSRFNGGQQLPNMQQQIDRVFRTFDRDNSGSLSFDEFISGIVMMNKNKPRRDRIDYVIRQNNPQGRQGNGRISPQYGHQVFRRLNDYYGLPPGTEHQVWKQIDQQNRGYITHEEIMTYISQQSAYSQRYQ